MKKQFYADKPDAAITPSPLKRRNIFSLTLVFFVAISFLIAGNATAQTGKSLNFDGTKDRVDLPFLISGSYTKEAWIYVTNLAKDNNIVSGAATAFWIPTSSGSKLTAGQGGGFNQVHDPATFVANVWTHVAVTYDAIAGSMRLYKNGVAVDSAIGTVPSYVETANYIGAFAGANYFAGNIDEVRIWSTVRTGAQILANMSCTLTGDEPFLTAYYNFNQGTGGGTNTGLSTLNDLSHKCTAYNGSLVGFNLTGATSNWVTATPTLGSGCSGAYPNINVTGNSVCIPIGKTTTSLTDFTDFGDFGLTPLTRSFIIQNTGIATLNISGATISGPDAAAFTITTTPAATVAGGGSTSLIISFNPTAPIAAKNATVTINSNDSDELSFTFNITGFNRGPGRSLDFDGVNDMVDLPNLLSGSYTKEAWVYSYNSAVENNIISGTKTAFWAPNSKGFKLTAGHGPTFDQVQDPTPLVANSWTHVAVTFDSTGGVGNMKLYKNGVLVSTSSVAVPNYTETTQYIGAFAAGNLWNGKIDEVRIWNVVRTGAEILRAKDSVLTGDEPGLIGYYRFNNGVGSSDNTGNTTLVDISDKCIANDGTLSGFALTGPTSNWVNDSSATFTGKTSLITIPNIAVSGNAICITTGDNTPSTADNTDFGMFGGTTITKTFNIANTGTTSLGISGVTITGANPGNFAVTTSPATTVAAGGNTTLKVSYTPITTGTVNAIVNISNTDPDEGPFTFAITGNSTVLPVSLVSFKGEKANEKIKLSWQTASEHNNKGFEIQRSADGTNNWSTIGFVAASAFPGILNTYAFTDNVPLSGINAYRLKQVDLDGNYTLSQVVVLNLTGKGAVISFYPNPARDRITLQFTDNQLLNSYVNISSADGHTMMSVKLVSNKQEIELGILPKGLYLLSFNNGEVRRLIRQ